jgi:hypothetical protein
MVRPLHADSMGLSNSTNQACWISDLHGWRLAVSRQNLRCVARDMYMTTHDNEAFDTISLAIPNHAYFISLLQKP